MRRCLFSLLALLLAGTSCTGEPPAKSESPVEVAWHERTLPVPPGPPGRLALRDAAKCQGEWYVVGAVYDNQGESRPATWRSPDGDKWTSLSFAPQSYYARRNVITSVACRDGKVALIGSKPGGAHSYPRVSTWYARADGSYVDAIAPPELYGGPEAVNIGRLVGGSPGWMIVGNRSSGAAVWTSRDATAFTLVDDDPQLSSDTRTVTQAVDLTATGDSWTVVGSVELGGRVVRAPLAWVSPNGTSWRRQQVPYAAEYADLQRVIAYRDGVLAVGVRGDGFGAWRRTGDTWRDVGRFGKVAGEAMGGPSVATLTTAGGGVVAAVSDGARYSLWASTNDGARWRRVLTPTRPSNAGGHLLTAVGAGDELLLLADDGATGRVWLADPVRFR